MGAYPGGKLHLYSSVFIDPLKFGAWALARDTTVVYICVSSFCQIASQEPSFKPETVLDFGSGLGTVPW